MPKARQLTRKAAHRRWVASCAILGGLLGVLIHGTAYPTLLALGAALVAGGAVFAVVSGYATATTVLSKEKATRLDGAWYGSAWLVGYALAALLYVLASGTGLSFVFFPLVVGIAGAIVGVLILHHTREREADLDRSTRSYGATALVWAVAFAFGTIVDIYALYFGGQVIKQYLAARGLGAPWSLIGFSLATVWAGVVVGIISGFALPRALPQRPADESSGDREARSNIPPPVTKQRRVRGKVLIVSIITGVLAGSILSLWLRCHKEFPSLNHDLRSLASVKLRFGPPGKQRPVTSEDIEKATAEGMRLHALAKQQFSVTPLTVSLWQRRCFSGFQQFIVVSDKSGTIFASMERTKGNCLVSDCRSRRGSDLMSQ